ncbi:N-6 DNA methylase [uncultured Polaribacter sp.]|uniref:class I SAM-dependent DNA methyltransferase n=1 Tax=uncultured Polaribacter sp. TaxID=174711 RepID=UPI0026034893|nr:N-6 DNA methylase [uncultured Polaribacter sp.]
MANVGAVVSSIRNIMRQDRGISGDAQRLEQLGWMLFLKIIDDKDQELEISKENYISVIPEKFQWRTWATDAEGITGDELLEFIDSNAEGNRGLFATLRNLTSINNPKRAAIVKEVFEGSNNFMKSGYEMRKVINKLNEVNFNDSKDKQVFGDIYESILVELRDAGNKGEYYTPRAVTQLMTKMTNPILGEKVLDPAAGTGGFLTEAIDHVRAHYVHTVKDEHKLQNSITGWELKPVAYVLGLTNLILHEIDIPDYVYQDSLKIEYNGVKAKDKVDVILANPPFGASIADGVETNFPASYRCKESADLFVILMLQLLKPKGRCAIVLPDGSITGDGVKARIREKLLTDCNLHTIIRLPQTTFFPATVSTNLLFFEKGSKTKDIWYYDHKLPEGQKSYSKTKPIQFNEFQPIIDWWENRKESDVSWKVNIKDLKNWNLDIKNPNTKTEEINFSTTETIAALKKSFTASNSIIEELETLLK